MIKGWYYLHENNDLIYKNDPGAIADIRESDFCKAAWSWDGDRATGWTILVEALALGAKKERIYKIAEQWKCDDEDAKIYASLIRVDLGMDGAAHYATRVDFENLQESPCGFGDTYLEAMAELAKALGFKGGKMWTTSFEELLKN